MSQSRAVILHALHGISGHRAVLSKLFVLCVTAILCSTAAAADAPLKAQSGDLHVHTAISTDSYLGANKVMPAEAYPFARGEAIPALGRFSMTALRQE